MKVWQGLAISEVNFFLDIFDCGTKMNTPALREFNAGVFCVILKYYQTKKRLKAGPV